MRQTSARHIGSGTAERAWRSFEVQGAEDPNGNSVNLEEEVLRSVEATRAHNRALTIYNTSLQILRSSIGRGG